MHNKISFTDQLCGLTANLAGKGGVLKESRVKGALGYFFAF